MAIVVGGCGGVAGGFLSTFGRMGGISEFDVGSSLAALAGALIALFACPSVTSRVVTRLRPKKQQDESADAPAAPEPEREDQLVS